MKQQTGHDVMSLSLDDRYLRESGTVYLPGVHALVRLPIDQNRRDRRAGLRIGTFISGYPGSPLAGYDLALNQARALLQHHDIVHVPGANEELAVTALMGTQMLDSHPHSRFDGVVALWYGKGPGVDRAGDALKHGNFAGTSENGAVVILSGEDHEAKSSTVPYQQDYAFVSAGMPILYPASVAEFLELGQHAIALSRYSGCWVALKLVAPLCDGGGTVGVDPSHPSIVVPTLDLAGGRPFKKSADFRFFPGLNVEIERQLYYERHQAVIAYARANQLDRVEVRSPHDRVGIISAGKSYADVRQALLDVGADDDTLRASGIRLLRMSLIYPIDEELVRDFARDLEEIIIVEEKRDFLEGQVKAALCGLPHSVRVVGKFDEKGQPFFPIQGGMDHDLIAERLADRLLPYALGAIPGMARRRAELHTIRSRQYDLLPQRTPNYCSGCPHNTSTRLLEGQVAWGSPGCHAFASIIEQPERHIQAMTQYGGEGLPWIGLAPFTDRKYMVQNVGDGAVFHSSYLNIRFCVAAGVNITFKILYNGSIANTGAQDFVGGKSIPDLIRLLEIEGVKRIALVTKTPRAYAKFRFGPTTRVYPVQREDEALKELAETEGVTVYIYDGVCANERRRKQKRGTLPRPNKFVVINEEVCENCGHCGALTNCMSLHKVETEFGEKTQIHQSSCNQDYSCLGGDCPSFVTMITKEGTGLRKPSPPKLDFEGVPEPPRKVGAHGLDAPWHIYMVGVGGTGVITLNALLCHAAVMEGKHVLSYDQTGAAQKWGPVVSSLVIAEINQPIAANRTGAGKADSYLAFDIMAGATKANLDVCEPNRTRAVINMSLLPSGEMIRNVQFSPPVDQMIMAIKRFTQAQGNVYLNPRDIAEGLFGDYMMTNTVMLGAAYQAGVVPLTAASIEAAIRLNGVLTEENLQAFRYGRLVYYDPERVNAVLMPPKRDYAADRAHALGWLSRPQARAYETLLDRCSHLDEESRQMLAIRIAELLDYQGPRYAKAYVDFLLSTAEREQAVIDANFTASRAPGDGLEITHAVIRYLYKLMAYKDEYEVARLQLKQAFQESTRAMFSEPRKLIYNLHPPLLRAIGLKRKLQFGERINPVLRVLRKMKVLRGTPLDPFGYAHVRREERRLIGWYKGIVNTAVDDLRPETLQIVLDIAELPDLIRGYEKIKLKNIGPAEAKAAKLLANLREPSLPM